MRVRTSVIAAMLLVGSAAVADEQHREGEYGGVTPGQGSAVGEHVEHAGKHKRPPAKDELTWIGFAAKDGGGGELFFQAPGAFTVAQRVEKGEVVLVLEGLRRQVKNLRRPLDTRYFDTSIARVTARPVGARGGKEPHKAGVEVRIAFKTAKDAHEASVRTATEPDGMFYAYLDFGPAGSSMDVKPSDAGSGAGSGSDADSADGN